MSREKTGPKESAKTEKTSFAAEEAPVVEVDIEVEAAEPVQGMSGIPLEQLAEAVAESEYVDEARFDGAEEFASSRAESLEAESLDEEPLVAESMDGEARSDNSQGEKIHLEFYGSEYIRERAPQVMDFAESVVEEWKNDGNFEGLPVEHPLAQLVAAKALRKAKDVEKVLEEKGVMSMARIGVDFVKSKLDRKHD